MNEICFNELSTSPLCVNSDDVENRLSLYLMTLKATGLQGIKKVRYAGNLTEVPLCENYSLQDYCNANMRRDEVRLIISMATKPQVPEDDDEVLTQYLETETAVVKEENSVQADGFNAAFCMGTYCIGFDSEPFWESPSANITVTSNGITEDYVWCCVALPKHLDDPAFLEWKSQFLPVVLIETGLQIVEKQIRLESHHGKDKLMEHAQKLISCPYVEGILTSLAFQNHKKVYIDSNSDFAHGLIDVVLYWEEHGYSMRVKTTGRSIRETIAIAEILKRKYGKGS